MKSRIGLFLLAFIYILVVANSLSFAAPDYAIRLVSGEITPGEDTGEFTQLSGGLREGEVAHCLVQMQTIPSERERTALELAGLKLLDPIPQNAWLATLSKPMTPQQAKALGVRWVKSLQAVDKQHPRILRGEFGQWADYEVGKVIVTVRLYADVPKAIGERIAKAYRAVTGDYIQTLNLWVMAVDPAAIDAMAGEDAVEWIDALPPPLTAVNDVAREVVGANTVQATPYNLDGAGITVCVYDGGMVDASHSDFAGRITLGESGSTSDHATHVAGSVGGDGANSSGQYRGMAPGCDLVSYEYESCDPYCLYNSPQDIESNYQSAITIYGANLATNSIGSNVAANGYDCAWNGDYESTSELLDNIVRGSLGNPFLVAFAAGNERGYGTCGTTYSTMGVPAGAKNIITVGATDDSDAMTDFSSWGPTDDGRTKPEVCAPGEDIYSTIPGNSYGNKSGTSMATPITSGCIALVLEQFAASYPGLTPLPSTVKAILINTALDLGNTGPDYAYGFGRIDVQAAVDAVIDGHFLEGELATGQTNNDTFNVSPGTPSLRVSLSWMDPAAAPMSNPTLINDLDITLTSPSSTVYYPYILNPGSPSNPATTGADHINNSEQIVVSSPESGKWIINISSTSMPTSPQSYSVAASHGILSGYGTVNGAVTDASTLLPISGALVKNQSGPQSGSTNGSGWYELYLPASTLTLEYSAWGYISDTESVTVPDGGIVTRDKALTLAPSAELYGYVYDPGDAPVYNVKVTAVGTPVDPVYTDISGYYSMTLPTGDEYTVRASASGFGSDQETFVFNSTMQQDFHLTTIISEDFETGDFTSYPWEMGGNAPWTITSTDPYEGTYCSKSGTISDNQTSDMSVNVNVVVGDTITFYYKVSSESNYDYLRFYIDGVQQNSWSGTVGWTQASYSVTTGNHTFLWRYSKDYSVSSGSDCAWIDYITFPPIGPLEPVTDVTVLVSGSNIELYWTAASGATSYNVYRVSDPFATPTPGDLIGTATTPIYTDENILLIEEKAFYVIVAVN